VKTLPTRIPCRSHVVVALARPANFSDALFIVSLFLPRVFVQRVD
jgi:hypothetical protein